MVCPTWAQVAAIGVMVVLTPQASVAANTPGITFKFDGAETVKLLAQVTTGGVTSATVTTLEQVATFPEKSVTVNVAKFVPTLEQPKLVGETDSDAIPQLSVLPLSI